KQFYSQSNASDFADFDQFYEWLDKHDLRPNYPTGCSRPLVSNTFHDAIRESNVKIVANSISRLSKTSVVADDQEYSVDLLIMATGFSLNNLIPPYDIKGKNGNHLSESWKSAPETYLGMVTTDFPNLFFLYGPNTNTNSTAVTFYVESQVNYIEQVMREYLRQPFSSIEIKPDVLQNYSLWLEEKNKSVSETSDCSSYYQNDRNINISTFPGCYREYEKLTKDFAVSEFSIERERKETNADNISLSDSSIKQKVASLFSQTTQFSLHEIELERALREYPLDSILIVDFIKRLNAHWQLELEPTIFFEHTSLLELSEYLSELLLKGENDRQAGFSDETERTEETSQAHDDSHPTVQLKNLNNETIVHKVPNIQIEQWRKQKLHKRHSSPLASRRNLGQQPSHEEAIAVIGAHGYFPQANDVDKFWGNLVEGNNSITEIPADRWSWEKYFGSPNEGDKTKVKWGGFINEVGHFDPLFFKMSPKEAELMDPQHRLFLQSSWELLEGAGYNPNALNGRKIGVILGINLNDYSDLVTQFTSKHDVLQMSGLMHLFGANRLSYLFGFIGPSEVIDTACSSSLIAVHRAIQSIYQDDCEMMIAGGSNLILTPKMHLLYSKAGMLSEDGACKTFSSEANGYVRGEGVAAILLKKLSVAKKDGDVIWGIVRGSAENHGGKANSLTAPNPKLQAKLIEEAMLNSQVDPRTIGYIECHGTGTELGDPIEIKGIQKAYKNLYRYHKLDTPQEPHCGLGSV
ncbi:MAG: beta-ketoacyl synthase N-terminal-like domain-containing protein, partial [Kangiellaceae bacterium]|nr:beta-ketoacyl synthase N-terminal-like domain-containing protein [Kangiellaceae bacterium]